jgi:hypothetical protein
MKVIVYGISVIIILSGAVFALQGLRFLPSAVMYGKPEWVVIGGLMILAGVTFIAFTSFGATWRKR